jgi:hypothetical protein
VALQEQNDAVHRDVDLLVIGAGGGLSAPVPVTLLDACCRLRERFGLPRSSFRERVLEASARGETATDLEGWFPVSAPAAAEYVALVEEIERFADAGFLFIEPPAPRVIALRRWFVEELGRQLAGAEPSPAPDDPSDQP